MAESRSTEVIFLKLELEIVDVAVPEAAPYLSCGPYSRNLHLAVFIAWYGRGLSQHGTFCAVYVNKDQKMTSSKPLFCSKFKQWKMYQ